MLYSTVRRVGREGEELCQYVGTVAVRVLIGMAVVGTISLSSGCLEKRSLVSPVTVQVS